MKNSIIWLVFAIIFATTGCKKEQTEPENHSKAVAVLNFKNGNVNNLEAGMWGIFDGSQSYGYDSTQQFYWWMGDGTQMIQTDQDRIAYRYANPGNYQVQLMVFDFNGNCSIAEINLEVVPSGTLKAQVLLRNATEPDPTGRIEYTIALALDSCQASGSGLYYYMILDNNGYSMYPFASYEIINGAHYGLFKISDYNCVLNFTYLNEEGDYANIANSVFYNPEMGLLQATFMNGEMLPLDQLEDFLPGDIGDDVFRIYKNNDDLIVYINHGDYSEPINPWIGYSSDNIDFQNQRTYWIGGTGWSELHLSPYDVMYFRFGGKWDYQQEYGEMHQSMFWIDEAESIVVKFIPLKK